MADKELDVLIVTRADLADLEKTQQAVKEVGKAGEAAGEQMRKGGERAEVSHRALRFALHQLGPEFAHLGHAATLGFANPATAGVIALTVAVGALIKHFSELDKKAEELSRNMSESLDRVNESMRKVAEETETSDVKFALWYHNLSEHTGQIVKQLDELDARLKKLPGGEQLSEQALRAALGKVQGLLPAAEQAAVTAHLAATDPAFLARLGAQPGLIEDQRKKVAAAQPPGAMSVFWQNIKAGLLTGIGIPTGVPTEEAVFQRVAEEQAKLRTMEVKQTEMNAEKRRRDIVEENRRKQFEDLKNQERVLLEREGVSVRERFAPELQPPMSRRGLPGVTRAIIAGEEAVGQGRAMNIEQQQAVSALVGVMRQSHMTNQQIVALLNTMKDQLVPIQQKVAMLETQFKASYIP